MAHEVAARRGRRGRGLSAVAVALALALLGVAAPPTSASHEHPSLEELGDSISRMRESVATQPPRGDLPAPVESRDPSAPGFRLRQTSGAIRHLAARLETTDQRGSGARHLERAAQEVDEGAAAYGSEGSLRPVFESLSVAVRALTEVGTTLQLRDAAAVERLAKRVTESAREVVARLGGAYREQLPAAVVRRAAVLVRRADEHVALGQFGSAVATFGEAATTFANPLSFDLEGFEQRIRDRLDGETVGYAYSIASNGVQVAADGEGVARAGADVPEGIALPPQSPSKEMYTMSMSKTISAVALLQALDEEGISVDSPISPHLPEEWDQGPGVWLITFRNLLTHTSGLPEGAGSGAQETQSLAALEDVISQGSSGIVELEDAPYVNTNFSLLRVLIPRITIGADVISAYTNVLPEDEVYAGLYADWVRAHVFVPAGIDASTCGPDEPQHKQTFGYLVGAPDVPGYQAGDWSLGCGATGWHLSANELGSFLAHLRFTSELLSPADRQLMDSGFLGWLNPKIFVTGVWGEYRGHGGDSHNGDSVAGMTGCMMNFPNGVQAALLVNSRGGDLGDHACTLLRDAHDQSWSA